MRRSNNAPERPSPMCPATDSEQNADEFQAHEHQLDRLGPPTASKRSIRTLPVERRERPRDAQSTGACLHQEHRSYVRHADSVSSNPRYGHVRMQPLNPSSQARNIAPQAAKHSLIFASAAPATILAQPKKQGANATFAAAQPIRHAPRMMASASTTAAPTQTQNAPIAIRLQASNSLPHWHWHAGWHSMPPPPESWLPSAESPELASPKSASVCRTKADASPACHVSPRGSTIVADRAGLFGSAATDVMIASPRTPIRRLP